MDHLLETIKLLSATAAGSLINAIAAGIILTCAISVCLRLFPGIRPASRFTIWIAVLFAALAFHLVPLRGVAGSYAGNANVVHLDVRWGFTIIGIWSLLTLTRMARLVRSAVYLRHVAAGAIPIVSDSMCDALLCGGSRPALLCTSNEVDRPSVVGFFRPRVLIPQSVLAELSPHELQQIIMHEMEHLRRGDDWTNLIQKITLALFPLNPALGWIERRLCMERELACDDCVLDLTSARKTYASCLTNLAEHSLRRRTALLALGAWGRRSELAHRVDRILRGQKGSLSRTSGYVVTGVFIAGLFGSAVSLTRMPLLVNFSSATATSAVAGTAAAATNVSLPMRRGYEFPPTLVKVVMPEPSRETVANHRRSGKMVFGMTTLRTQPRRRNLRAITQSHVEPNLPHLVLAVSEGSEPAYAALPVGNGWIIIQL